MTTYRPNSYFHMWDSKKIKKVGEAEAEMLIYQQLAATNP
jgi:hypothetical protein